MARCSSLTRKREPCKKPSVWPSRYCLFHQDPLPWFFAVAGIAATVVVAVYQEKDPRVEVQCGLVAGGDPAQLDCSIVNTGRREARDLTVSFTKMLPLGTQVVAAPELALRLQPVDSPPDPEADPRTAALTTAFVVVVPRVAAGDRLSFRLATADADNKRAAAQLQRIQSEVRKVLDDFGQRLSEANPADARRWRVEDVWTAHQKRACLFSPAKYSFEAGRRDVSFLTESELLAEAVNADFYTRYKTRFLDIYQNRPEFRAPVIRVSTKDGDSTYASYPPYLRTYVDVAVPVSALPQKGPVVVRPPVPKEY